MSFSSIIIGLPRDDQPSMLCMFHLINQVISALEMGCFAARAFIDLSKAFDLKDNSALLQKLNNVGIRVTPNL